MSMAARILCIVAFIAVLSQFGGTLAGLVGLPNPVPAVRDCVLFTLGLYAIYRTDVFKARGFFIAVLMTLLLLIVNIAIAAASDLHFAGVYYARLYLLPVIFAVAARGLLLQASPQEVRALARIVFWCGLIIVLVGFGLFAAIEVRPDLLFSLMGALEGQTLATAWYIAGGTWLRMGLPATSPNAFGLILALYLMLVIPLLIDGRFLVVNKFMRVLVIGATLLAMLMSFSRSSWLALALGGFVMFVLCRREWGLASPAAILKLSAALFIMMMLLVVAVLAVDSYSGGFIVRWIELNASGTDPSMQGHGKSFVDALEALPDYFWIGYPKGTVSARALLFGGALHNAENSIISVFFEMGVPLGLVFLTLVVFLLKGLWVHKIQWGVVAGFGLCAMFLPYVFEPDMIALFLTVTTLLGRAMQLSQQGLADNLTPTPHGPKLRPGASTHKAFQATVFDAR